MGLASAEGKIDDVMEHSAVVSVDVEDGSMQKLEQLGELAKIIVVGEHGGTHEGSLLVGVDAEDICTSREKKLDDANATHGTSPVKSSVFIIVDAHVGVKVGWRVDEKRGTVVFSVTK